MSTKKDLPVIEEVRTVFVTIGNTDMTEGKGRHYPLYISDLETTARRLGIKKGVMGTDCEVTESTSYRIGSRWLHTYLTSPSTEEDIKKDAIKKRRLEIAEKVKRLGISQDDIDLLIKGQGL